MNPRYRLGIAGLGTVGSEVARHILDRFNDKIEIVGISARDKTKQRDIEFQPSTLWFDNPADMIGHCDGVVELMGGTGERIDTFMRQSLAANKHVITANKAYLAQHQDLIHHENIRFEAAVAGGIPIIQVISHSLRGNKIEKITGILNGTCNYILTLLQNPQNQFEDVLKQAQEAGYAEADPYLDISGQDTLQKAIILGLLAFGDYPIQSSCAGIDKGIIEVREDEVIRLVAEIQLKQSVILIDVAQKRFKKDHDFAMVTMAQNAIFIEADPVNTLFLKGYGAGGKPTASAVLADILHFALSSSKRDYV